MGFAKDMNRKVKRKNKEGMTEEKKC